MSDKIIGFYGGKILPLHLGHIYSILYSASRCDELHVFLFINTVNEDELISRSIFPKDLLTPESRELVLKYEFSGYDNIKIHTIDCKKSFNIKNGSKWDYNSSAVIDSANCLPNIIFSSDKSQQEHLKIIYPFADFEIIDEDRCFFNISSTRIRQDGPFKNWEFLPKSYKSLCAKSIVILGEKMIRTRLLNDLSKIFSTSVVSDIDCDQDIIKKKILEARFNSDKIFFLNSSDNDSEKFIPFYNLQNYRFSINFTEENVKKYNSVNLSGNYCNIFKQAILRVRSILFN